MVPSKTAHQYAGNAVWGGLAVKHSGTHALRPKSVAQQGFRGCLHRMFHENSGAGALPGPRCASYGDAIACCPASARVM